MTNRLSQTTSPYLQQHAHNPVDWHPWGAEALDLARDQNKPILLSIGYSACHWCHVMAHESFEDPDTAAVMNELYVNIKVDREERPDLDKVYQSAHQLLAQRPGGWPLTVFLTPDDHAPFFAGTYFPPAPRHGLPGFRDLLRRIEELFRERKADIRRQNRSLVQALSSLNPQPDGITDALDAGPLDLARRQLEGSFDAPRGGFGKAPKFPHVTDIEYLLRRWASGTTSRQSDEQALHMATFTLRCMALGGIHDQLGGGFCRYSVDDSWMIPHFEKMLYDNGPLLAVYCDAWQATGDPLFRRAAEGIAAWTLREMQSPEGGYYSSLDADSEGHEGKFYVWDRKKVEDLLEADDYPLFARHYGLDRDANFEGKWHLHVHQDLDALAKEFGHPQEQIQATLDRCRKTLFAAREMRVRPGRDDKILTSWNALMIKGMARAARVLGDNDYRISAERALSFTHTTLWWEGKLLATYKDGTAHLAAYLDDYAYLLDALLELLQTRWRHSDLTFAIQLADVLLECFEDEDQGGFFFTADDHETLIHRPKSMGDESMPSGNGVAALALLRLGHLLGDMRYIEAARRTLSIAWPALRQLPSVHAALLMALDEYLHPSQMIVIRGAGETLRHWQACAGQGYAPTRYSIAIPEEEQGLPGLLADKAPKGEAVAYVCTGTRCGPPVTELAGLQAALVSMDAPRQPS